MFYSGSARLRRRVNYWAQRSKGRSPVIVFSFPPLVDWDDGLCHCIPTPRLSSSVEAGDGENSQVKGKNIIT